MPIGIRWLFILIITVPFIFRIKNADTQELDADERPDRQRFYPYFPNYLLPMFLGMLAVIALFDRSGRMGKLVLGLCFSVFIHICGYYLLLSVFMPVLRKRISARVCAALWLIPNYLYLMVNQVFTPQVPKWVVYVPKTALLVLCGIWLAGFVVVLTRKIWSHYQFRNYILKDAWEESDRTILDLWWKEQRWAGFKNAPYPLVRSPVVRTPLTIGCRKGTIRVVLPERDYTPEELTLIFRHELVHIGREDSLTKFFLTFCTAMCWFNPLMWLAMRRSADDLELSCDETVLLKAEDSTRRQYADLLLRTAGDERGFTTCLSASAQALRYRLRHVMQPKKRSVGSITAGVVFFALLMTCGHVTLAFDRLSGGECIFGGGELSQYVATEDVYWIEPGHHYVCRVEDDAALKEYLADLTFYEIADYYELSDESAWSLSLDYQGPDGETNLLLRGHELSIRCPGDQYRCHYFIQENIDWDYLRSTLSISA